MRKVNESQGELRLEKREVPFSPKSSARIKCRLIAGYGLKAPEEAARLKQSKSLCGQCLDGNVL